MFFSEFDSAVSKDAKAVKEDIPNDYSDENLLLFPTISLDLKDLKVLNSIQIKDIESNFDRVEDVGLLNNVYKTIKLLTEKDNFVTFNEIAMKTNVNFRMNRKETGICIELLHFEGSIISVNNNFTNYFNVKFPKCKNYIQFFNGRITSLLMTNICEIYLEKNQYSKQKTLIRFSLDELTNFFIIRNPIWPRIKLNKSVIIKWVTHLITRGYLNQLSDFGLEITIMMIKYGIKKKYLNSCDWPYNISKSVINNQIVQNSVKNLSSINKNILASVENMIEFPIVNISQSNSSKENMAIDESLNPILKQIEKQIVSTPEIQQVETSFIPLCSICSISQSDKFQVVQCKICLTCGHLSCIQFHSSLTLPKFCTSCCKYFHENKCEEFVCPTCINQYYSNESSIMCDSCIQLITFSSNIVEDSKKIQYSDVNRILNVKHNNNENQASLSYLEMLNESNFEFTSNNPDKIRMSLFDWTVNDVKEWFKDKGYEDVANKFKEQEIDGHSLALLIESDLKVLNLDSATIQEILNKIKLIKMEEKSL